MICHCVIFAVWLRRKKRGRRLGPLPPATAHVFYQTLDESKPAEKKVTYAGWPLPRGRGAAWALRGQRCRQGTVAALPPSLPPPPPPHPLTPTAAAEKRCPAGLTASRAFLSAGALFANSRRVPCGEERRPLFGSRCGFRIGFSQSENCRSFYPKRQFSILQLTLPLVSCACVHLRLFVPRGQQREAVVQRLYVVLRPLLWLSRCCPCGLAGLAVGCSVFGAAHRWRGHDTFFVSAG